MRDLCTRSETSISCVESFTVTEGICQWYSKDYGMKLSYIMRSLWYQVVIKFSLMIFCAILKMAWKSQPVSWEASECLTLPSVGDRNTHQCFTFRIGWQAVYLNTHFSSSFASTLSRARSSWSGITYLFSSLLLPLFIALQFFPCSNNLSVMFHLFCFLLFLYLRIKNCPGVRAEGWEVGGWSLFLFQLQTSLWPINLG